MEIGKSQSEKYGESDRKYLEKELNKINKTMPKNDGPYVYGSFTNWQPI